MGLGFREATSAARGWSDREQRARFHKAGSTERGGSSSALPWVRTCARASGMWVSPPLVWGGALSVANAIFIWFFFCVLSQDPVRCAGHRAAPSCPGRTCTSAYARAEMRMRVPPPLVWGRALSVATVFFVWFFFCVSSQYLVRCAVHSAAPSRPGGTRTCAYARRARARAEMRDVSGRDRDDAPRSSLRSQLGGTVIVCAVRPRRICVSSTPARLGLGTCHCERYISSSGLRPVGTSDDATMQSVTASHGIHVTNRTRMSRSTPPITNGVVFSTPARLGLGTCHCERVHFIIWFATSWYI